jgi:Ca-activated chloride channel family protein
VTRIRLLLTSALVAGGVWTSAWQSPPAQQPPPVQAPQAPTFRAGIDTVPVYATVLDTDGRLVTDLTKDEFLVRDEGQSQPITHFSAGQQAITAMVLLDTSQSMGLSLDLARLAAEQLLIRLAPGDRARFGTFDDRFQVDAEFVGERDALVGSVRAERYISNGTRLWDALDFARHQLENITGRRILVVLTDGEDTQSDALGYDVYQRMRQDELMFYAVQVPRAGRALVEKVPPPTIREMFLRFGDQVVSGSGARLASPREVLERFAWHTGGGYVFLDREADVGAVMTQIVKEMHFQYVLGFTPLALDGRMHDLDVRVSRDDLTVRARKAYRAGGGS